MPADTDRTLVATCRACGFEAPAGDDVWETVSHPNFGTVTRCPKCSSTDIHSQ